MSRANRLKRGSGQKTISIVVDGETEAWYFQMMREHEKLDYVNIKPELPKQKSLKEQFELVKSNSKKYDYSLWILDFDTIIKESREAKSDQGNKIDELKKYLDVANAIENIEVFVNTPCLEYWFLLHEKETGRFYQECEPIIRILSVSNILPGYTKSQKYFKTLATTFIKD